MIIWPCNDCIAPLLMLMLRCHLGTLCKWILLYIIQTGLLLLWFNFYRILWDLFCYQPTSPQGCTFLSLILCIKMVHFVRVTLIKAAVNKFLRDISWTMLVFFKELFFLKGCFLGFLMDGGLVFMKFGHTKTCWVLDIDIWNWI